MRRTFAAALADLLFTTDERMRPRNRLTLLTDGIYLCWSVAAYVAWRTGKLDDLMFHIVLAVMTTPRLFFYPLVRSGLTKNMRDCGLSQAQMLHGIFVVALGYYAVPWLRAPLLQCLCLIQVFGLATLGPRQALTIGLAAAASLMGVLGLLAWIEPTDFDAKFDALRGAFGACVIVSLALISRHYALIRAKVREQKNLLSKAVEQVQELVSRDSLTGLYNRQHMQELLERERARLKRGGHTFCVALLDLDHFKRVNDSLGHHVGDEVLIGFAKGVKDILRATDIPCRWGGEEFLLLMPDTNPADLGLIGVERLREHLAALQVSNAAPELRISFSAGLAGCGSEESLESLLERADRALYTAKELGRNRSFLAEVQQITDLGNRQDTETCGT